MIHVVSLQVVGYTTVQAGGKGRKTGKQLENNSCFIEMYVHICS